VTKPGWPNGRAPAPCTSRSVMRPRRDGAQLSQSPHSPSVVGEARASPPLLRGMTRGGLTLDASRRHTLFRVIHPLFFSVTMSIWRTLFPEPRHFFCLNAPSRRHCVVALSAPFQFGARTNQRDWTRTHFCSRTLVGPCCYSIRALFASVFLWCWFGDPARACCPDPLCISLIPLTTARSPWWLIFISRGP